jgi:hypothetical protein
MKTWTGLFLVVLARFANASVEGFVETFDGDGEYETVNGTFTGLDNPEWRIGGDPELRDGGLALENEGPIVFGEVSDELFRPVIGRGSFTERIEIKELDLGELHDNSPLASQGKIIMRHILAADEGGLTLILGEYITNPEGKWGVSVLVTGHDPMGGIVPRGPHVALEINYDDTLSHVSFSYDNDINDNVSAMMFGPYDYTGTFMETHESRLTFVAIAGGNADGLLDYWSIMQLSGSQGDFNSNGTLDAEDIDLLSAEIRSGTNNTPFDLTSDQRVDELDRTFWVETLRKTYFGDSDLDGEFNTTDLVQTFQAGVYEDAIDANAGWASGDWNGDADFNSRDLVLAFQSGGYEIGPRPAAVPEPSASLLLLIGIAMAARRRAQVDKLRQCR